jgi:hypothetical protein
MSKRLLPISLVTMMAMVLMPWLASSALSSPAIGPLAPAQIANGDFESGPAVAWTEHSLKGWPIILSADDLSSAEVVPHSGSWAAWLGGDNEELSYVKQQVTVPSEAPFLAFWRWIDSYDSCGYDIGQILVEGSEVASISLCTTFNTGGWEKQTVDLSAYVGQTVWLQFQVNTDVSLYSSLFLDDVSFEAGNVPPLDPTATIYLPLIVQ